MSQRRDRRSIRIARKTLLALAGLVSTLDHTWTTDRVRAAQRWAEIEPASTAGTAQLLSWVAGQHPSTRHEVADALDRTIEPIVVRFAEHIGLWP